VEIISVQITDRQDVAVELALRSVSRTPLHAHAADVLYWPAVFVCVDINEPCSIRSLSCAEGLLVKLVGRKSNFFATNTRLPLLSAYLTLRPDKLPISNILTQLKFSLKSSSKPNHVGVRPV
jgi:hypothetical protein